MRRLVSDITTSPDWLADQQDRLLAFEVFRAFVMADGEHQLEPDQISEKTTINRGFYRKVLENMSRDPKIIKRLKNAD